MSRPFFFRVAALLLPAILLLAGELGLRLTGSLRPEPLFLPLADRPEYSLANPAVIRRFFANPDAAPGISIETAFFRTRKPDDVFRIVVQGGSSAAGFPYGLGASPAGALQYRLHSRFPQRKIEVISTAMAAVNSYTLLDFVDEILEQEPDVVVVYAGHNEFLGILGVGSAMSSSVGPWATRTQTWLRAHSRVYRTLERLAASVLLRGDASANDRPRTMMERVAGEKEIPLGSDIYQAGVQQFRRNMGELLSKYARAGVPVLLSNLASNERSLRPFISGPATPLQYEAEVDHADGLALLREGQPRDAVTKLEAAVARQKDWARAWFDLGNAHAGAQQLEQARTAYETARDLDLLRFRAPGEFNRILAELAEEHGAILVDTAASFRQQSRYGVPGSELFLEHVHPNLQGYRVLGAAFYDALLTSGLLDPLEDAVLSEANDVELPVSEVDSLFGHYKVRRMMSGWPFQPETKVYRPPDPQTPPQRLARALFDQKAGWLQVTQELRGHYEARAQLADYILATRLLADGFPFLPELQYEAGEALLEQGRPHLALRYARRALAIQPENQDYRALQAEAERALKAD